MGTRQGNSRSYTLDRLKRERPDLYAQVINGELKANRAAIRAGFRARTVLYTIPWTVITTYVSAGVVHYLCESGPVRFFGLTLCRPSGNTLLSRRNFFGVDHHGGYSRNLDKGSWCISGSDG